MKYTRQSMSTALDNGQRSPRKLLGERVRLGADRTVARPQPWREQALDDRK
jgi:hypothetical protein